VVAAGTGGGVSVVGAEPFAVDDAYRSLLTGRRQPGVESPVTLADGLLTGIGARPFTILSGLGVDVIRVSEASILAAALFLLQRMKLVVEPSGATTIAAIRAAPERFENRRVGVILSGGNTDLAWLEAAQRL
jgi:threonine dehydratase